MWKGDPTARHERLIPALLTCVRRSTREAAARQRERRVIRPAPRPGRIEESGDREQEGA